MAHHQDVINRVSMLPVELKRNLTYLRELDQQFQELQKQYEKQCIKELETAKKVAESGNIPPNALHFSDDVGLMNKACDDVAEKKVALAQKTYDLVDSQIRKLDKCLKKFDEQFRKEREQTLSLEASEQATDNLGQDQKDVDNSKPNRKKAQALVQPVNMDLDIPVDPNEPTYCYCNQVSFGEMVACDNPNCAIEWFHFDCVGLKEQPKGKWYCPDCAAFSKRRRRK